jgi:hypothetical protein
MLVAARGGAPRDPRDLIAGPAARPPGLEPRLGERDARRGARGARPHLRTQAFATACAVASGTATLETALFGTPLV